MCVFPYTKPRLYANNYQHTLLSSLSLTYPPDITSQQSHARRERYRYPPEPPTTGPPSQPVSARSADSVRCACSTVANETLRRRESGMLRVLLVSWKGMLHRSHSQESCAASKQLETPHEPETRLISS